MAEPATKEQPTPTRLLRRVAGWLLEKTADHLLQWILAGWAGGSLGAALITARYRGVSVIVALRASSVPLWLFLLLLLPGAFGVTAIVRRLMYRSPLHVILDPIQAVCLEGMRGTEPILTLLLRGSFANRSKHPLLLRYAYIQGTTPVMHFFEPVRIPPETMTMRLDGLPCTVTRPRGYIGDPYRATFVFVDASGAKFRQQLSIRYIPFRGPHPQATPETEQARDSS